MIFTRARREEKGLVLAALLAKRKPPPTDCGAIQIRLPFTKLAGAIREKISAAFVAKKLGNELRGARN
jgi:hypothetical protein